MALNPDEVEALANTHYTDVDGYDEPENTENRLFCLLVDVADAYRNHLEAVAGDQAAPFLGGITPLEALMRGLRENLELRRDPTAA